MADALSLLVLDPLHTIMQGTVIEITVAGALIMKPNCCNADCYLLPTDTVMLVDTNVSLYLSVTTQHCAVKSLPNCCHSSVQCDRCVNRRSVIPSVCSAATFVNGHEVQSCSHPHDICNKRKMFSP